MAITGPRPLPEAERFWAMVDKGEPTECWPWTGATNGRGYGVFRVGSQADGSRRMVTAHRYVCDLMHEAADVQALHHCDNKACCNPAHLYVGNHADNMRDASERGRTGGRPMPGERNGMAKLTPEDVRAIRASTESGVALARRYGVSGTQVGWIRARKSWRHVA